MNWEKGQSLIELLIAIGIFVIAISALAFFVLDSYVSGRLANEITEANFLAEEGIEATRSIRDNSWDNLTVGSHGLDIYENKWVFSGISETISKFTRVITVEDIGIDRKKITSQVTWQFTEARPQEIRLVTYFTNWAKPMPLYLAQLHYRGRADDGGEGAAGKDWTQATDTAQWTARQWHTSVVSDNKIWVIGGWDGARKRDVWYSTSGVSWTQATDTAQWTARESHTSVVFDNKIWVIGGYDAGGCKNDVWYSTSGVSWTQATNTAQWTGRYGHTSVVYDNKIWVIGGWDMSGNCNGSGSSYCRDVWYSTSGVSWTQATNTAQWSARYYHTSVVSDNKIWVIGGWNESSYFNDVWYSTSGVSWTQATNTAQWSARYYHTSVVSDNKIWVIGGYQSDFPLVKNDVWYSTSGVSWTQATDTAQWSARYGHTSVTTTVDNKIWVIGGMDNSGNCSGSGSSYCRDVWYSAGATWKAAEDTAVTNQAKNENVRVRFSIKNTEGLASNYQFRLQFAELGSYTNCTSVPSVNFSDVPTTIEAAAIMATSTYFADGDQTTNQLTPEGTFTSGRMVEYPSNQTAGINLDTNYFTEIEYNFQFTNNATASIYCLRVNNAGTVLNQYTKVATIYVNP